MPRLEQARIDPIALGFAIGDRARQQRALRPGAGAARVAPRRADRPARRRTRLDRRPARSPARRPDRRRGRAVAAAARRRRAADPQRDRAAAHRHRLRTARRVERARDAAGDQLHRAGADPGNAAADQRSGRSASPASRRRRSRPLPRWAAAAAPTASSRKDASRSPRTSSTARCASSRPSFFSTMGVPIVKGRNFNDGDRADGQRVMIVSARLAAVAFPGQDPIGKRISCCEPGPNGQKVIVGVAGDIRSRGPAVAPRPEFYLPIAQAPDASPGTGSARCTWSCGRPAIRRRSSSR